MQCVTGMTSPRRCCGKLYGRGQPLLLLSTPKWLLQDHPSCVPAQHLIDNTELQEIKRVKKNERAELLALRGIICRFIKETYNMAAPWPSSSSVNKIKARMFGDAEQRHPFAGPLTSRNMWLRLYICVHSSSLHHWASFFPRLVLISRVICLFLLVFFSPPSLSPSSLSSSIR